AETPSDCVTTSTPVTARFTVAISSASPAIFSSLGWSTGILRADRANARTECPASRAAFTVSRPIPLLAPTISTLATVSMLPVIALGGLNAGVTSLANQRSCFLNSLGDAPVSRYANSCAGNHADIALTYLGRSHRKGDHTFVPSGILTSS